MKSRARDVAFSSTAAPAQPEDLPGVADKLGVHDVGLLAPPLPAAPRHAGLRDQLQVQQLLRAADRAGEAAHLDAPHLQEEAPLNENAFPCRSICT